MTSTVHVVSWATVANLIGLIFVASCLLWVSSLLLRFGRLLSGLERDIRRSSATADRIEAGAAVVAKELTDARHRADAIDGEPGEASDAAAQS